MLKRVVVLLIAGTLLGLGAFFLQNKDKELEVSQEERSANEKQQEITKVPSQEEILKGKVSFKIENVVSGNEVIVNDVTFNLPGFVVIYEGDEVNVDKILGDSGILLNGTSENIIIPLRKSVSNGQKVTAVMHTDNGNEIFDSPMKDLPIKTRGSNTVSKTFTVN